MKNGLTNRQKELLSTIYGYIKNTGYPPTFEEMRQILNVSSNQSIIDLLEKLRKGNYIRRKEGARSLSLLPLAYDFLGVPPLVRFAGFASAGSPIQSMEISGEWQTLSDELSKLSESVSILKVLGDSMINAGINDGDAVLVQTKKEFVSGEIVYAQIGDGGTIKRFVSEDRPPYVYLKPENPKYNIIPFTDEVELKGKVISVFTSGYWKPIK